jgi:hypothetical protein
MVTQARESLWPLELLPTIAPPPPFTHTPPLPPGAPLYVPSAFGCRTPDSSIEWNPEIQPALAGYKLNPGPDSMFYCVMQNVFTALAFNGHPPPRANPRGGVGGGGGGGPPPPPQGRGVGGITGF